MTNERILIADDEANIVDLCTKLLVLTGYRVEGTTRGREAIARLEAALRSQDGGFDLLLVDIKLPDVDGLTVLRQGRELDPNLATVVITGYGALESAIEALHAGAQQFVAKPFGSRELLLAIEEALAQRRKEEERLRLRAQLPILEIGQASMAGGDVEDLAGRLLEVVAEQMDADRAVLLLPDTETGEWRVAGPTGDNSGGQGEPQLSLWQDLLQEGDVSDAVLVSDEEVAIALRSGKGAVGLLGLGRSRGNFTPSERDLLTVVAGRIAITLENANLYRRKNVDSRD